MDTRQIVGHEALTRFSDGTRPDRAFAWAVEHGAGLDLERMTIARHLEAAARLPEDGWLSLNASVSLIELGDLPTMLEQASRAVILEITENEPVTDYEQLRERIAGDPRGAARGR